MSGLVQVWFRLELEFNSLELDSEVGRLLYFKITPTIIMFKHNALAFDFNCVSMML